MARRSIGRFPPVTPQIGCLLTPREGIRASGRRQLQVEFRHELSTREKHIGYVIRCVPIRPHTRCAIPRLGLDLGSRYGGATGDMGRRASQTATRPARMYQRSEWLAPALARYDFRGA
jgi:hypothetical protein